MKKERFKNMIKAKISIILFFIFLVQKGLCIEILKIVSGKSHTLLLTNKGEVFGFGWNKAGQLGNGNDKIVKVPVKMKLNNTEYFKNAIDIAAGDIHSMILKKDGTVWCCGGNFSGQLGNLTNENSFYPVLTKYKDGKIFDNVIKITAGWDFSVALKKDGTVWAWGDNKYGQIGDGTRTNKNYPVCVKGSKGIGFLKDIVDIKAGAFHVLALSKDGTVWAWGDNEFGQLGDGTFETRLYPVKVLNPEGKVFLKNIVKITCGAFHSFAIDKNGNLFAWGKNWKGQLGDGTYEDRNKPVLVKGVNGDGFLNGVIDISAGRNHTIVLNKNGEVFVFGSNKFGQLGNMILKKINFPIPITNGKKLLKDVILISASGNYSVLLLKNGDLYFCGTNEGELEKESGCLTHYFPLVIYKFRD